MKVKLFGENINLPSLLSNSSSTRQKDISDQKNVIWAQNYRVLHLSNSPLNPKT